MVNESQALIPINVLSIAVVIELPAVYHIIVLLLPELISLPALYHTNTLAPPVVMELPASSPNAVSDECKNIALVPFNVMNLLVVSILSYIILAAAGAVIEASGKESTNVIVVLSAIVPTTDP